MPVPRPVLAPPTALPALVSPPVRSLLMWGVGERLLGALGLLLLLWLAVGWALGDRG